MIATSAASNDGIEAKSGKEKPRPSADRSFCQIAGE